MYHQAVYVSDRTPYCYRKITMVRSPPHETHSMAPEAILACSREFEQDHSDPSLSPSASRLVAKGPLHPLQHTLQIFIDASNEGCGAHLGDTTARGVWSDQESLLHINFLELKAVLLALKSFEHLCRNQIVLIATVNTTVVSYINKEGGMKFDSLCALLWRLLSWCHPRKIVLRARHIPGCLNVIAEKLQTQSGDTDRVVPISAGFSSLVFQMGPSRVDLFATRFNHRLPKFVSPVPDQSAWAVDALSLSWENLDAYAFPPISLLTQVVSKLMDQGCCRIILIVPGWSNMPWFWDLVSLSSQIPFSLPLQKDLLTTIQWSPSQEPLPSKPACVAPRAPSIQEQGFSDEVAALIEAPQRSSTRTVYKSKGAIFVKWCDSNEVDFRSPSLKHIADFLLYLFKERHLQPNTIECYRTAIADMIGNDKIHISKDEKIIRNKPKGRWGVPSWNLSLVLHQLTKPLFEPMRKASLKHLTFPLSLGFRQETE